MLESLSDKVAGTLQLQPANFIQKETQGRCFPLFFQGSFLRTPSGTAPVKCVPFEVRLNDGKNLCHLES